MSFLKKSQVSMEFMMLLGFIVFLSIPMVFFYQNYSTNAKLELSQNQVKNIATKIVDNAESVYYLGEPSQSTIKVTMPEGVSEVVITSKEINFRYLYRGNYIDIPVMSNVNLTGTISPSAGRKQILIKSIGDRVNISDY